MCLLSRACSVSDCFGDRVKLKPAPAPRREGSGFWLPQRPVLRMRVQITKPSPGRGFGDRTLAHHTVPCGAPVPWSAVPWASLSLLLGLGSCPYGTAGFFLTQPDKWHRKDLGFHLNLAVMTVGFPRFYFSSLLLSPPPRRLLD